MLEAWLDDLSNLQTSPRQKSMSDQNSIVNLGDLGKPANTLIKKISDAVGGYFRPYQIKRVATAEAEANIIKAQSDIEVADLHRRAITRFVAEEAKKQQNIESITDQALPQLAPGASPDRIEDDWITNFFDKCRIVSDKDMQALWARVLSGEANAPGTYSRRTVDFLGTLDRNDAEAFALLMRFSWRLGDFQPVVFDLEADVYKHAGLNFPILSHLDDIGLISFEHLTGFLRKGMGERGLATYFGKPVLLEFTQKKELQTGKIILTKTGQQLATICEAKPVDGIMEYVVSKWAEGGVITSTPIVIRKG
ncbi:MAG TPA: DUF2806 domain-containing protein [Opitutaceae bacterium]|nr:DUF2806 domain-containing protein [Opitutaceae bacterium]